MTVEFYTYVLLLASMLYKTEIITKDQLKKLVEMAREDSDKTLETLIEELEELNSKK